MNSTHLKSGWIRTQRDALGLSSYEVARRAGVSQPTVINWERRERRGTITLASLRRAAKAMDCILTYRFTPGEAGATAPTPPEAPRSPSSPSRSIDPNSIWGG